MKGREKFGEGPAGIGVSATHSLLCHFELDLIKTMRIVALAWCLLASGVAATSSKNSGRALRSEFVKAMDDATKQKKHEESFVTNLLSKAKPVAPEFQFERNLADDGNAYENYGLNLTDYALKYLGCQNIHTFSDDLAEDDNAESVLAMNRFVMLRLCPRDTCSNYNEYGCNGGYGDYMITMEEYLAAMYTYHYSQYEEYCDTCYNCMHPYAGNSSNYDDGNATDTEDAGDDDYAEAASNGYVCEYYDVCENYKDACKDYVVNATDMSAYFECSEFNVGNNVGYLGPHCRSDGKTIGIGIYGDDSCNSYVGDWAEMSSSTGMDFSDGDMQAYYSEQCISCLASVSPLFEIIAMCVCVRLSFGIRIHHSSLSNDFFFRRTDTHSMWITTMGVVR
jgi:hypothetical protein